MRYQSIFKVKISKIKGKKLMDHFRPLPQMSHREMQYIKSLSLGKSHILEFGAGNSTLFWSKTYSKVTSVEHHLGWFNKINTRIARKATNTQYFLLHPNQSLFRKMVCCLHNYVIQPTMEQQRSF